MNEAETRAEHIDPALKAAGWGVGKDGSRLVTDCHQLKMAVGDNYLPPASRTGLKKP